MPRRRALGRSGPSRGALRVGGVALAGIGFLVGCAAPTPEDPVDLVVFDGWRIADAEEDSFPEHRAASKRICDPSGFQAEDGTLEIDTARCAYVTAAQESRAAVEEGQPLSVLFWHLTLVGRQGAQAHIAVTIDGIELFDSTIPMPASAEVYELTIPAPRPIPAGAPVAFHVHNHGANSYRFGHLRANPPLEE